MLLFTLYEFVVTKPFKQQDGAEFLLDENLLEEITNLYNEDNKKDSNNKIDNNVNKEEKEEVIEDKAIEKEKEKGKKSKEDKKDKLTEDFLNNLETTMREGK